MKSTKLTCAFRLCVIGISSVLIVKTWLTPHILTANDSYNSIAQFSLRLHLYALPICTFFMYTFAGKKMQFTSIDKQLRSLGVVEQKKVTKYVNKMSLVVTASTVPLITDVYNTFDDLNVSALFTLYAPGLAVFFFVTITSKILEQCRLRFELLNARLLDISRPDLKTSQRVSLALADLPLDDAVCDALNTLIVTHKHVFDVTRTFSATYGLSYCAFFFLATLMGLMFAYDCCLDLYAVFYGAKVVARSTAACYFWPAVFFWEIFKVVGIADEVAEVGNETRCVLQRLRSVYPSLDRAGDIYCLQLSCAEVGVNAAGLFELRYSLILEIVGLILVHLLVLLQLDMSLFK